jgi:hypothetical protein
VERHREREVHVERPREVVEPRQTVEREVVEQPRAQTHDREVVAPATDGVRTEDMGEVGTRERTGRFDREPERTRITDDVRQSERATSGPGSRRDDRLS